MSRWKRADEVERDGRGERDVMVSKRFDEAGGSRRSPEDGEVEVGVAEKQKRVERESKLSWEGEEEKLGKRRRGEQRLATRKRKRSARESSLAFNVAKRCLSTHQSS